MLLLIVPSEFWCVILELTILCVSWTASAALHRTRLKARTPARPSPTYSFDLYATPFRFSYAREIPFFSSSS